MPGLGMHFALDQAMVQRLKKIRSKEDRIDFVSDVIEEDYMENMPEFSLETDQAWAEIHCLLTDGRLDYENGKYPLNHAIVGGEQLGIRDESILSLKTPPQVAEISAALDRIGIEEAKEMYFRLTPDNSEIVADAESWEYVKENLVGLNAFYQRAAEAKRHVLFSGDF